jgi:acyl dehydratase
MAKAAGPYDIDAVRKEWIGKKSEVTRGRYPVEYDPIRRHCHMVEDRNPLFLDPEYARETRFGEVIAPPVMLDYFAGNGAWPPVQQGARLMQGVPTRGDRASSQVVIVDVMEKPIRLDPRAVWITIETQLTNQSDDLVATIRNTVLFHREPEEVAADAG